MISCTEQLEPIFARISGPRSEAFDARNFTFGNMKAFNRT
jgi:hypothetical protein